MPDHSDPKLLEVLKTTDDTSIGTEINESRALQIVKILNGYRTEAVAARKGGINPRDAAWEQNIDLYWNRMDFSQKASWQAREVMPEATQFIDRWAAAMREALTAAGDWYSVATAGDTENDLSDTIKKFMDVLLKRVGRNQMGQPMDFSAVFEEQMKLGAMMNCAGTVMWRTDNVGRGYVAIEPEDPRGIWLDATGRGLYRIRRSEIDLHDLLELIELKDGSNTPIYNLEQISRLTAKVSETAKQERDKLTGGASETTSTRKPIVLHEYLCNLVEEDGATVHTNMLAVIANDQFLIRGPEENPFAHKLDWVVYCPLVTVPLSPYGRSYAESWGNVARAFNELTNLLLDGIRTTALRAFVMIPSMLEDPAEALEGVHPNKTFMLEDNGDVKAFLQAIELGRMPPEVFTMWQGLKNELREGAAQSEIALGQLPPKGDITATEINESQQGGAALVRSVARTVESRFLQPMLDLVWKVGLQHLTADDEEMVEALGQERVAMLIGIRKEILSKRVTFTVDGISSLVDRAQKLRNLMAFLQTIAQSEEMMGAFLQKYGPDVILDELMRLHGIDKSRLQSTGRQQNVTDLARASAQGRDAVATAAGAPSGQPTAG